MACGILVPGPGIESGPTAVKVPSLNHWTAREFPEVILKVCIHCCVWPLKSAWLA